MAETQGERDIIDKVVLEQVCHAVPPAVWTWLMKIGPATLDQAAACLENYFLAEQAGTKGEWATPEKGNVKTRTANPDSSLIRWFNPSPDNHPFPSFRPNVTRILPPV